MMDITFTSLDNLDFAITDLFAIARTWPDKCLIRYTDGGRPENLLFYLISGNWTYYVKGHELFTASSGDIMFIPHGCCYETHYRIDTPENYTAICLRFTMTDSQNIEIIAGNTPIIFKQETPGSHMHLRLLFEQTLQAALRSSGGKLAAKSLLYHLLEELASARHQEDFTAKEYRMIYPAICHLNQNPDLNLSVCELAEMCYMSESSFRRKFHLYAGMSPLAYRNTIRIRKADELLSSKLYSVNATAEALGFNDASHFCKTYKKLRGHSPLRSHTN